MSINFKLSNLAESVTKKDILEFFCEFKVGEENVYLFKIRDGNRKAFIDLGNPDLVGKALKLNNTPMDGGNVIEVSLSNADELKNYICVVWKDPVVVLANVPYNATPDDIEKFFEDLEDFKIIRIVMSLNVFGSFSGSVHVEVENMEQAHRALEKNNEKIDSRVIRIHCSSRGKLEVANGNSRFIESKKKRYELRRLNSSKSSLTSSCSETSNSLKMTTKSYIKSTPYERPRQTERLTSNLITIPLNSSSTTNSKLKSRKTTTKSLTNIKSTQFQAPSVDLSQSQSQTSNINNPINSSSTTNLNPHYNYQPPLVNLSTDSSSNLYPIQYIYNTASNYPIAPQMMTNVYGQPPNVNVHQNQSFNQNYPSIRPIYHQHPLVSPNAYNNSLLYQNQNIYFSTINHGPNVGMMPNVHNQPQNADLSTGNSSTTIQSQGLVQNYPIINTNTTSTNLYGSYSIDNRAAKTSKRNSSTDTNCYIVVMKRVPIKTTVDEVTNFFAPLVPKDVSFLPYINDDVSSGIDVKVSFSTYNHAEAAMKFNGNKIRGREAELLFLSASQKPSN